MQYKTVAGPVGLVIRRNENYADAVKQYAAIIDQETMGGWELLCIQQIPVTKDKGCLAGCLSIVGLASQYEQITFNMLVFVKKD